MKQTKSFLYITLYLAAQLNAEEPYHISEDPLRYDKSRQRSKDRISDSERARYEKMQEDARSKKAVDPTQPSDHQTAKEHLKGINSGAKAQHEIITSRIEAIDHMQEVFDEAQKLLGLKDTARFGDALKAELYQKHLEISFVHLEGKATHLTPKEQKKYYDLKHVLDRLNDKRFKDAQELVAEFLTTKNNALDMSNKSLATVRSTLQQTKDISDKVLDLVAKTKDKTIRKQDFKEVNALLKQHFSTLEHIATTHSSLYETMSEVHEWAKDSIAKIKDMYKHMQDAEVAEAQQTSMSDTFEQWVHRDPNHVTKRSYGDGTQTPLEKAIADGNESMMQTTVDAAVAHDISLEDLLKPLSEKHKALKAAGKKEAAKALKAEILKVQDTYLSYFDTEEL